MRSCLVGFTTMSVTRRRDLEFVRKGKKISCPFNMLAAEQAKLTRRTNMFRIVMVIVIAIAMGHHTEYMTPLKGCLTNFLNAGIHVVATQGAATFFSYIGLDDFINDNSFTKHSGCPVIEGEKKIIFSIFPCWGG